MAVIMMLGGDYCVDGGAVSLSVTSLFLVRFFTTRIWNV